MRRKRKLTLGPAKKVRKPTRLGIEGGGLPEPSDTKLEEPGDNFRKERHGWKKGTPSPTGGRRH